MEHWQKLSALIVGCGSIGRRHGRVLRQLGLGDVRVCDPSQEMRDFAAERLSVAKAYEHLPEALADEPNAVFICTPTALHVEQAIESLNAGADVFIEKPLSTCFDRMDELEALASTGHKVVTVGHCFRFHEGLRKAKHWLKEGRIGRLASIRAVIGEYIPEVMPNYRNMYISEYSGAYELMHEIDLALWFAEQQPVRVMGIDGNFSDVHMKSPDAAELIVEFKDRCLASVHLDFFQRARHRQTELFGTNGTILIEFASWDKCGLFLYEAEAGAWHYERVDTDRDDMFREMDRLFLQAIASRSAAPVSLEDGKLAVQIVLASQESARTGKEVRL